jgi:hypothetical protein
VDLPNNKNNNEDDHQDSRPSPHQIASQLLLTGLETGEFSLTPPEDKGIKVSGSVED